MTAQRIQRMPPGSDDGATGPCAGFGGIFFYLGDIVFFVSFLLRVGTLGFTFLDFFAMASTFQSLITKGRCQG
jgi:hypothetical protein